MNGFKQDKLEIELLSREYIKNKMIIEDVLEKGIKYPKERFKSSHTIVNRIENALKILDEDDRLIIQKELIEGERGYWYLEYFSSSTYYRHRDRAYENFLHCL